MFISTLITVIVNVQLHQRQDTTLFSLTISAHNK
ncbi:hypothetical protein SAMN05421740_101161 [Parapedobacter koreensis]|uniref:Uncharacterized protein n=1 Tax=Parapedobacter koreensis TaxID=332977 RepID=A0A1H7F8G5_9SPHI|nr:hypothetical protein SAMN05421740_101161 [Parapedobacter koreensis]